MKKYDDIECPYCGEGQVINHDDGQGYEEDMLHEQECKECGKTFVFTSSLTYFYEAQRADCLNGAEHDFKLTTTNPREFSKMRCSMCEKERELTDKERKTNGIRTPEEYFEELAPKIKLGEK